MTKMIDALHADHIHVAKLLDFLDGQLEHCCGDDENPDFRLMLDAMDYIKNYPDLFHHPREDIIYDYYTKHYQDNVNDIEQLLQEHQEMCQLTHELYVALQGVVGGTIVDYQKLKSDLAHFLKLQREHMDTEETSIFPMLKESLSEKDWKIIEKLAKHKDVPVFGAPVEQQYEALYQRVCE